MERITLSHNAVGVTKTLAMEGGPLGGKLNLEVVADGIEEGAMTLIDMHLNMVDMIRLKKFFDLATKDVTCWL